MLSKDFELIIIDDNIINQNILKTKDVKFENFDCIIIGCPHAEYKDIKFDCKKNKKYRVIDIHNINKRMTLISFNMLTQIKNIILKLNYYKKHEY